jgi:hypothetical protein
MVSFKVDLTSAKSWDEQEISWDGVCEVFGQRTEDLQSLWRSVIVLVAKKLVTDHHSPSKGRIKTMQVGTSGPRDRSPLNGHGRITEMRERVIRSTVIAFHSFQSHSKWTKCHQMTLI